MEKNRLICWLTGPSMRLASLSLSRRRFSPAVSASGVSTSSQKRPPISTARIPPFAIRRRIPPEREPSPSRRASPRASKSIGRHRKMPVSAASGSSSPFPMAVMASPSRRTKVASSGSNRSLKRRSTARRHSPLPLSAAKRFLRRAGSKRWSHMSKRKGPETYGEQAATEVPLPASQSGLSTTRMVKSCRSWRRSRWGRISSFRCPTTTRNSRTPTSTQERIERSRSVSPNRGISGLGRSRPPSRRRLPSPAARITAGGGVAALTVTASP